MNPALRVAVLGGKFGSQWVVPTLAPPLSLFSECKALCEWSKEACDVYLSLLPSQNSCLLYVGKNARRLLNGEAGVGVNCCDPRTPAGTVNLRGGQSLLAALYGGESSQRCT